MRKPLFQLYLPFFAVILGQALLITLAPSTRPAASGGSLTALDVPGAVSGAPGTGIDPVTGAALDPATSAGATGAPGVDGAGAVGPTSGPGSGAGAATGAVAGAAAAGDTSHCVNGRQHGITYMAPPCAPKFTGDNGGATYPGVTADTIKIVAFFSRPNEQVDAILAPQGLATTRAERDAFVKAAETFLNKRYELYGRKVQIEVVEGDCPTTPPNIPKCKQAAREVAAKKPFMVVWNTMLYSEVFAEWARAGIISLGGTGHEEGVFTRFRPYRYDANMDGSRAVEFLGEYYCKKLAGKMATHSGRIIHSSIGARGQVKRKLGISTPSDPANVAIARRLAAIVSECDGGYEVPIVQYESDINRSAEQSRATTAAYIQAKVTTVTCLCDPIAPVFGQRAFTQQQYFPEILASGMNGSDSDLVGRLHDEQQRQHNFGLSHQPVGQPIDKTAAGAIWRDGGMSGNPCMACTGPARYWMTVGALLQQAGPNLHPLTVERGSVGVGFSRGGWGETKGNPYVELFEFGQGDYTGVSDVKEQYWSDTATSPIDGRPGAFVPLNGGRRYRHGEFSRDFTVPVSAQ